MHQGGITLCTKKRELGKKRPRLKYGFWGFSAQGSQDNLVECVTQLCVTMTKYLGYSSSWFQRFQSIVSWHCCFWAYGNAVYLDRSVVKEAAHDGQASERGSLSRKAIPLET